MSIARGPIQNHYHQKIGEVVNFDPKPADYISEGADQTRGWFYTMHAVANMLHDNPSVAYKNVVCLGLLMAADGTKMSKSKGNIVSPWDVFEKFGADVARFWFYSVNAPGDFKNFDEKSLDEVNKKVFNPLRNVVSFYEMYKGNEDFSGDEFNPYAKQVNILDTWILAKLDELEITVTKGLDTYNALEPARAIREFINELSTWYIRRSRDRFKSDDADDRKHALRTTQIVLRNIARIMAPFTPFIAEEIFQTVKWDSDPESVHLLPWLDRALAGIDWGTVITDMEQVRTVVTLGLEARQKTNIKVRQPLASITINQSLPTEYLDILKDELNVKEVIVDEPLSQNEVRLDTEITEDLRDEGDMRDLIRKIQDMRKSADFLPSDRVIVFLTDTQPDWFSKLQAEVLKTVGAERIEWKSSEEKIEKIS
jgi:isoleucyl-tRNA synthetase